MSSLARQTDPLVRRLTAERARVAGRARRAEAARVSEMARALLRDARATTREQAGRDQRAAAGR